MSSIIVPLIMTLMAAASTKNHRWAFSSRSPGFAKDPRFLMIELAFADFAQMI